MTSKPFFKAPRRKRESEPPSEEATHGRGKKDGRGTVGRVSKSEAPRPVGGAYGVLAAQRKDRGVSGVPFFRGR